MEAKLVTSRQARAIAMLSRFPKNNGLRKVLPTYVDISIWPSLEGRVAGCCLDNNKLAHEKPRVLVPRNSQFESIH